MPFFSGPFFPAKSPIQVNKLFIKLALQLRFGLLTLLYACVYFKTCTKVATYSLVEVRIPKGDRPPCEEILSLQVEGVDELVDLMKRCWDMKPSERPHFRGNYLLKQMRLDCA